MREHDPLDISSLAFWSTDMRTRDVAFAELRAERPVSWHRPIEVEMDLAGPDEGFWAVARHEDIVSVSRDPEAFCSGQGVLLVDIPQEMLEASNSFLATDAPRHRHLRGIVSAAFTPRQVRRIEEQIGENARVIVGSLRGRTDVELVSECAALLPAWTIFDMIGLPEDRREALLPHVEVITGANDPELLAGRDTTTALLEALGACHEVAHELCELRRSEPGEDLFTSLVQAEVDGERLTDDEIAAFFVLLCVGGNDTTRHTTTHVVQELAGHPEQRAWLLEDLDARLPASVNEMLRWASAVMTFRRTATRDVELGGQLVREGEKVVMLYSSGNRDERVFADPWAFDLSRGDAGAQMAFGGGGPHFCLGAHLARTQLVAVFRELLTQLPPWTAGTPDLITGSFIHGVKRLPVLFG